MANFFYPNGCLIAGVDEVGRGALVGPVITSAVILDPSNVIKNLADSKKLSEKRRLSLFKEIKDKAILWSIGRADSEEIDNLNILRATMLAMQRAVANLALTPDFVLVDGSCCPTLPMPSQAVVKGDSLVAEISAASIIAKVTRDREMAELDLLFPEYCFAQHKGYPTALHVKKLMQHGATSWHRRSFAPVHNAITKIDGLPASQPATLQ
ncbi:ribonuclease HII [Pantoea sp. Nvir]|uniref:ribonuclease HII n=1 Tax=Pantoea sp. Nvir TaxID=2576760 RepID=UPI001356D4CE|nr:ribonuclease HII [Pantoea sp. Nvir]MXP66892.1 ribonuclease HII [Pantoea sp. Nvir]